MALTADESAVLTRAITRQLLQTVPQYPQVRQNLRSIQHRQLPPGSPLQGWIKLARPPPVPDGFGGFIPEGSQHSPLITLRVINAARY
jgi:hypothetical protein